MILPPSTLLRASLSGCQASMPSALPRSICKSISLKIGRPGFFAVFASISSFTTVRFSRCARSLTSTSCASIDRTCLSSSSVDFRAYRKYVMGKAPFISVGKFRIQSRLLAGQKDWFWNFILKERRLYLSSEEPYHLLLDAARFTNWRGIYLAVRAYFKGSLEKKLKLSTAGSASRHRRPVVKQ